jgi:hypothetical protein
LNGIAGNAWKSPAALRAGISLPMAVKTRISSQYELLTHANARKAAIQEFVKNKHCSDRLRTLITDLNKMCEFCERVAFAINHLYFQSHF